MEIEKICYNCKYYKEFSGRYRFGLCENYLSHKILKDLILKSDSCSKWKDKNGKKV